MMAFFLLITWAFWAAADRWGGQRKKCKSGVTALAVSASQARPPPLALRLVVAQSARQSWRIVRVKAVPQVERWFFNAVAPFSTFQGVIISGDFSCLSRHIYCILWVFSYSGLTDWRRSQSRLSAFLTGSGETTWLDIKRRMANEEAVS
jgi:hypothetical protein